MTYKEIIKALECCSLNGTSDTHCDDCLYGIYEDCGAMLSEDALDLIKRQKAEIERLKPFEKKVGVGVLKNLEQLEYEKAEAIKEFAERLKSKAAYCSADTGEIILLEEDVDNLVKEKTEESNGE